MGTPDVPASVVLHARLAEQVALLREAVARAGRGEPDGVHDTRLASRRLRAATGTFRKLLDRAQTDPLRDELRQLGRLLSAARDAHVVHQRLLSLLEAEPGDVPTGARDRLGEMFSHRARSSAAGVSDALGSPRFASLLADLDRLLADPPWSPLAEEPAPDVLAARAKREWKRLRRKHAAVAAAEDRDLAIHDLRKAAKRFRYAAETLAPVWPKKAGRLVDAAHDLTDHLGERQDALTALAVLDRLSADTAGSASDLWQALRARERRRIDELDAELPDVWKSLARKRLRRWLG